MSASAAAPDDRPSQSSRSFAAVRASGMPASANTDTRMRSESCAPGLISAPLSAAGPSRTSTTSPPRRLQQHDPVRAAQEQATRVWRADMRRLLEQAEQRFADVCWTTATPDSQDQANLDSDLGHVTFAASSTGHIGSHEEHASPIPTPQPQPQPQSHEFTTTIPSHSASASSATFIWAHKAILYARAPNTFQTRFLNLRSPAAQLQHIGSTASLITLPLQDGGSHLSLASILSSSTQTGVQLPDTVGTSSNANSLSGRPSVSAKPRKSIRGTAPPSSFSMNKSSLRKPISRSSISRPLRRGSIDDAASVGFTTSDSEGEGGPASSHAALRLIHARQSPSVDPASLTSPSMLSQTSSSSARRIVPARKRSFASVASTVESHLTDNCSVISNASTLRAPISLAGVSKAYFEATLQYFYTGEEAMIDAFEFLFEDKLASDSEVSPEEKLDKLRSDLTFMWRGKLYSDVKIVLGDDDSDGTSDGGQRKRGLNKMLDIPDANMSVLSLAQTVDTDRVDSESEGDELTSFSSHRMILASRSQYFSSLLLSPYADSTAPVLHLPSPPFTPASLHFTLGFLYTGTLFFSNRTFDLSTAFALWRAGSYLQIETLQSLVVALIDREFCHGFHCSPQPCRKCLKRVPRTLAFASSPDVSESALLEPALGAVSGESFGMYWGKDIGQLDVMLQDRIVDSVSTRLQTDPTQVVAVLRQLSIVGQKIDTERSSRWVESLRLMAETVENRLLPVLNANLDKIVQSKPWSDLLDGVGSLGDVLEKCLVMLIDRLTESKAAKVYQTLVGQVLLREQGFEMAASRSAVENARASILRYLKKRWINVRALRGFNGLDKWCLQELADELEMSTQDLILSDEAPAKVTTPPSRLLAGRRSSPLASTGTLPTARGTTARSSLGNAAGTRLRTTSSASTVPTAASPVRPPLVHDGERVAGPNRMRAAVLNRNAARNSVTNGHRSLSSASSTSLSSPTSRPASSSGGRMTASSTPNARTAVTASTRASGSDVSSSRSAALNKDRISGKQSHRTASGGSVASVRSVNGSASAAANASPRPASSAIFSTSASAAQRFPTSTANNTGPGTEKGITPKRSTSALPIPRSPDTDKTPTKTIRPIRSTSTLSPRTPCAAALKSDPSVDHKTASSLEITSTALAPPTKDIDRNLSNNDFDFVTDGVGDGKARTTGAFTVDSELAKVDAGVAEAKQSPCSSSCSADTAMKKVSKPDLCHKSSFLRATPGPGGTFSLSTTDSGLGVHKQGTRTLSNGSGTKSPAMHAAVSVKTSGVGSGGVRTRMLSKGPVSTSKKPIGGGTDSAQIVKHVKGRMLGNASGSGGKTSATATTKIGSGTEEATCATKTLSKLISEDDAIDHQPCAPMSKSDSTRTIMQDATATSATISSSTPVVDVVGSGDGGGIALNVGIACIVQLHFSSTTTTTTTASSGARCKSGRDSSCSSSFSPSTGVLLGSSQNNCKERGVGIGGSGGNGFGGVKKVHADIRYIGPIHGEKGWFVGVQTVLSPCLSSMIKEERSEGRIKFLNQGCYQGLRYFATCKADGIVESEERVDRLERRKYLWRRVSPHTPFKDQIEVKMVQTKRQAEKTENQGQTHEQENKHEDEVLQMFVRSEDVVWIVQ